MDPSHADAKPSHSRKRCIIDLAAPSIVGVDTVYGPPDSGSLDRFELGINQNPSSSWIG